MYSAEYVLAKIEELKASGMPLQEVAWQAALLCVGWPYVFGARGQSCTPANRRARYKADHPTIKTACQNYDGAGSCAGCKWFPDNKRVNFFDCRGFTYWTLLKVFGWELMGTGCTTQWKDEDNWKAKGKVADGIPADTLVCLFYSEDGKEKTWLHTGFGYNGETVECSSGVQHFTKLNKKWTHWGVPACIGGDVPTPEPQPVKKPTLKRGSKGDYVIQAQMLLLSAGYDLGDCGIDGDFGKATLAAVKAFQEDHGLEADGVIGAKTWEALEAQEPVKRYSVLVRGLTKAQADALVSQYSDYDVVEE